MEPIELFDLINIALIVKSGLFIGGVIYSIYAFIIIRQFGLMERSFQNEENPLLKLAVYFHFFAALALTVLTVIS